MLKGSGAYPTPDSPHRGNWSDIYNAAQAGPRIPALGLSTPADTDSDVEDFQDANEEMATDEVPLTSRERQSQQQVRHDLTGIWIMVSDRLLDIRTVRHD